MIKPVMLLLLSLVATPALSSEAVVQLDMPGDGQVRLQRIEGTQIIADLFVGLFSDHVVLPRGTYRLQFLNDTTSPPAIAYCDIQISDDGEVIERSFEVPIVSAVLGNTKARIERVDPNLVTDARGVKLVIDQFPSTGEIANVPPILRATAWTVPQVGTERVKVKLDSEPGNAEVWFNGTRTEFRTNVEFFVPVNKSANSTESLLIRRNGYANVLLRLRPDDDPATFEVKLRAIE